MLDLQLLQQYDIAVPDRVVSLNITSNLSQIHLGNSYGDLRCIRVGNPGFSEVHVSSHPLTNILGDIVVRDANGIMFQIQQNGEQLSVEKLFSGKSVSCAASDGNNRIAINSKKHLRVFKREGKKYWSRTHELELSSRISPILMVFDDDVICIGTPSQYSIFRLRMDGTMAMISLDHVPVSGIIPACEIIPKSEHVVLSTNSRLGIFVSYDGMPVPYRFPLEWSSAPLAIRLCGFCIVALLPAGRLEVFTIAQSHLVQALNLGADCVISSRSFSDTGFCVVDQNHIYIARPMSIEDQIAYHVQYLNTNTAEAILQSMNPSIEMQNALNLRLAKGLMKHLLFQEAFQRLNMIPEAVPPNVLLGMLPVVDIGSKYGATSSSLESLIELGKRLVMDNIDELTSHGRDRSHLIQITQKDTVALIIEAHHLLASYLWKRKDSYIDDCRSDVDTVLLYLAACLPSEQLPFSVDQLLLPSNTCRPDFCEAFLLGKSPDLYALFLRSQQRYDDALQMWSESRSDFALDSAVALLCSLDSDNDLIYQHAQWIFEKDRKQAPVIFHRCSQDRVLSFLKTLSSATSMTASYLEYLIDEDGSTEQCVHTLLARMYLQSYEESQADLLEFLQKSTFYNPSELLDAFRDSGLPLIQERIIMLSRLELHDQVQNVYLQELQDIDGAIRYTESIRYPAAVIGLAQQLLYPTDEIKVDRSVMQQTGLDLLLRHGRDLDPIAALDLLPPDIPLISVLSLLSRVMNCTTSRRRLTQIERSLNSIERFRSEITLLDHQKRCIRVESTSFCRVCHQPIAGRPFSLYGSRLFHNQCR